MSTTLTKTNALNWFEIYVADFARAQRFYETVLDETFSRTDIPDGKMAIFPYDSEAGVGGALTQMEGRQPSDSGTLVYLNVDGKLDAVLGRVEAAGGKIVRPRFAIPPHGFIAIIQDTEGNAVGLHSMS